MVQRQHKTEKAEVLNDFFSSVFTRENLNSIPEFAKGDVKYPLENLHITPEDVKKKIETLKPNKSP